MDFQIIPKTKYDFLQWNEDETLYRERIRTRNSILAGIEVPFQIALKVKFRRSILGTFLRFFNENQAQNFYLNENKVMIADKIMIEFTCSQMKKFDYNNNLSDDVLEEFLRKPVKNINLIDLDYLYQRLKLLRLDDYNVNFVDKSVRTFRNLQDLLLCGNWIEDLEGSVLPRKLKFLELFANSIKSVKNLVIGAPKTLIHLGLSRNKLTNDSGLHLLGESVNLAGLITLDLSDCDIYNLEAILHELRSLGSLEGLLLEGNPCSMVMSYKDMVLNNVPTLIFLDGTKILRKDRKIVDHFLESATKGELVFTCTKLTGLSGPKKEKKVKQTIHLEFDMPLLQETEILEKHLKGEKSSKKGRQKGSKIESEKSSKKIPQKSKKSKKSKQSKQSKKASSPYGNQDEYDPDEVPYAFTTDRKSYSKVMSFPPVVLKSPENNLVAYRDTFRSCVSVKIVYLKVEIPKKNKKKRSKKKSNKRKKKGSRSSSRKSVKKSDKSSNKSLKKNKGSKESESETSTKGKDKKKKGEKSDEVEKLKEKVLKKVTLASFEVDLYNPPWNDLLEFKWMDNPKIGNKALDPFLFLEAMKSEEKIVNLKKGKKDKEGKKRKKDKKSSTKSSKSSKFWKSEKSKRSKKSRKSKKGKKSKGNKGDDLTCTFSVGMKRLLF